MKKKLAFLISTILIFTCTTQIFADVIDDDMNTGKIVNGKTMIPLRGAFEDLGFDVEWNSATNTATLDDDMHTIVVTKNNPNFIVDGITYKSDVAPQIINNTMYIPLRVIGDKIDADTIWDNDTRVASITYDDDTTYIVLTSPQKITPSTSEKQFYAVDEILTLEESITDNFIYASDDLTNKDQTISGLKAVINQCESLKAYTNPSISTEIKNNINAYANHVITASNEIISGMETMDTDYVTAYEHFDKGIRNAYASDAYQNVLIDHYNSFLD